MADRIWGVARNDEENIIIASPDKTGEQWAVVVQSRDGKNCVQLGTWTCDRKAAAERIEQILKWGSPG